MLKQIEDAKTAIELLRDRNMLILLMSERKAIADLIEQQAAMLQEVAYRPVNDTMETTRWQCRFCGEFGREHSPNCKYKLIGGE